MCGGGTATGTANHSAEPAPWNKRRWLAWSLAPACVLALLGSAAASSNAASAKIVDGQEISAQHRRLLAVSTAAEVPTQTNGARHALSAALRTLPSPRRARRLSHPWQTIFERRREALRLAQRSEAVDRAAAAAQAVTDVHMTLGSQAAASWRVRLAMKKQQVHERLKFAHASARVTPVQSPTHLAPAQAGIFAASAGGSGSSGQQSSARLPITPLPISTTRLKVLRNHAPILQCPSGFTPFAAVKYRFVGAASVNAVTSGAEDAIRSCAASISGLDGMTAVTSVGPAQAAPTYTQEAPACLREPQNNMTNPIACIRTTAF